jgi:glycine cleavage system H protein
MYPNDRRYTKDHEWIRLDGTQGRVGITDFAQRQLGDVVYVELPQIGQTVKRGEPFGTIESVKAVSELYAPVSGTVVEVNTGLNATPEAINASPHDTWIIAVALSDPGDAEQLLDSDQYAALVQ